MAAGTVVVFDFDKTIIDIDSDSWVVDEMGFTDLFNQLVSTMAWNSLMDKLMGEIHAHGKTIEDIEEVLRRVPIHPRVVPAIKTAHALGCDLRIVSDANVFFIETILEHLGIRECFSEINTNPGYVDKSGRLKIMPYHDFHISSHGCNNLCPPNIKLTKNTIPMIFGQLPTCPTRKLKERDYVMPRKNFPVWDLITENRELLKAEIHEWTDGEELQQILLQLINLIYTAEENTNQLLSAADCKLQTIPLSAHEAFPQPLRVPR